MKKQQIHIILILIILFLPWIANAQHQSEYKKELSEWDKKRVTRLKAEDGWLNLCGRISIPEGKSSFGSDEGNKVIFPKGTIDGIAGYFERKGFRIRMIVLKKVDIKVNGKTEKDAIVFDADSANNPICAYKNLKWTIIKRDDKCFLRLRNLKHPSLKAFKGIKRYNIDTNWRITAKFVKADTSAKIPITNILGQTSQQQLVGKLVFQIKGLEYSLDALDEDGDLFVIFADPTNEKETYPSGRFLIAKAPDQNGNTILDFNKAYNPPCAFTEFATCPLPPKQNQLHLPITAGEKKYGGH